jgi:quercetin dioxygenase-like cupin family protein
MPGIRCKIYKHNNTQLRLVEYSKTMPPHWCEKGHYGFILDGIFEIEFANETIIYQTEDGVFIPDGKNHQHKAKVLSETVKVIFVENI